MRRTNQIDAHRASRTGTSGSPDADEGRETTTASARLATSALATP